MISWGGIQRALLAWNSPTVSSLTRHNLLDPAKVSNRGQQLSVPHDDSEPVSDGRNVGLMPLATPEEINALAVTQGVYAPPRDRFTISTKATRRTTLSGHRTSSNLARIGQITTHIQSHGEQVETNVINKPKPRGRKEKAELSAERAREGRRVWRGRLYLSASLRSATAWDPTIPRGTDPALHAGRMLTGWSQTTALSDPSSCDQFRKWALCNSCPISGCNALSFSYERL